MTSTKNMFMETRKKIEARGWTPSKFVIELSEKDDKEDSFWRDMDRPTPWWKELYYKVWRVYDLVFWHYLFNKDWYVRTYIHVTKGYNTKDAWSLDWSFCKWVVPLLKEIKNYKQGVPMVFLDGLHDGSGEVSDENLEIGRQRLEKELDRMIWAFEFYVDDLADMCDREGPEWQRFDEGFYSFKIYFGEALWT